MQSGGGPYQKVGRSSSKSVSFCASVLHAVACRSKIIRSNCNRYCHMLSVHKHVCAHTETLEVPEVLMDKAYRSTGGTGSINGQGLI